MKTRLMVALLVLPLLVLVPACGDSAPANKPAANTPPPGAGGKNKEVAPVGDRKVGAPQ